MPGGRGGWRPGLRAACLASQHFDTAFQNALEQRNLLFPLICLLLVELLINVDHWALWLRPGITQKEWMLPEYSCCHVPGGYIRGHVRLRGQSLLIRQCLQVGKLPSFLAQYGGSPHKG